MHSFVVSTGSSWIQALTEAQVSESEGRAYASCMDDHTYLVMLSFIMIPPMSFAPAVRSLVAHCGPIFTHDACSITQTVHL